MGNSAFGYKNALTGGQLFSGSSEPRMGVQRLSDPLGSTASGWQTRAGVDQSKNGAWFYLDGLTDLNYQAFLLTHTNLTPSAKVRWRVCQIDGAFEPTPTVDIDFSADPFVPPSTGTWSFTRSVVGWRCTADGTWAETPINTPRTHYDPWTGKKRGVLMEGTFINRARNPRGEGILSPSTPPTHMAGAVNGGLAITWISQEVMDGLPGFLINISGTAGASAYAQIYLETTTGVATSQSQRCGVSAFHFVTSGDITGLTLTHGYDELNNVGTILATKEGAPTEPYPGINTVRAGQGKRDYHTVTTNPSATLTNIRPFIKFSAANGTVVNINVFIAGVVCLVSLGAAGMPFAPVYPPVGSPGTQNGGNDSANYIPPASTLSATQGTAYLEYNHQSAVAGTTNSPVGLRLDNNAATERYEMRVSCRNNVSFGGGISSFSYGVVTGNAFVIDTAGSAVSILQDINTQNEEWPVRAAIAWGGGQDFTAACSDGPFEQGSLFPTTWAGALPTTLLRMNMNAAASVPYCLLRWRYYPDRLSNNRLIGLVRYGVGIDYTAVLHDSGWVANTVPGLCQTCYVANDPVTARYVRCDIEDPANPDGFINVPLAYVGPIWKPTHGVDWPTAWGSKTGEQRLEARDGQEYVEPAFRQRSWSLTMTGLKDDEIWSHHQEMDSFANLGQNVLFIPDVTSSYLSHEALLGRLQPAAAIGYSAKSLKYRTWRARLIERL